MGLEDKNLKTTFILLYFLNLIINFMKRLITLLVAFASVMTGFALTIEAGKVYTIVNRNDNGLYVKDNGGDILAMGAYDDAAQWVFEASENAGFFYVKNVKTGRYAQAVDAAQEVNVLMGETPVEYSIVAADVEGEDCFGFTSTNQTVTDFTDGCVGWNWKEGNTVQSFKAVAGTNHRSFWKVAEYVEPAKPVVEPGTYYLYNVGTGKYLGDNYTNNNGDWTSHAELADRGRDFAITVLEDGFKIDPKMGNNHSLNAHNLYMDTGDGVSKWIFTEVEGKEGVYTITSGDFKLGARENGTATSVAAEVVHGEWKFVTREERINMALAEACFSNPVDMSWVVLGGTFPVACDHWYNGTWQGVGSNKATGGWGFIHCNGVGESWGISDCDINQTISVPNGTYKVKVQGIYASTGNDGVNKERYDAYMNGTEPTLGKVYANDQTVSMVNTYDLVTDERLDDRNTRELGNGKWAYQGNNEYSTNMYEGKGWTEEMTVVVTDGVLKVGVKVEGGSNSWVVLDNFTVTYLGTSEFAGNAPAAGEYFLYNVATGMYLGENNRRMEPFAYQSDGRWTTHAELDTRGRIVELIGMEDGFRIDPRMNGNHSINANNLFMDTGDAQTKWMFTPVEGKNGVYAITSGEYVLAVEEVGEAKIQYLTSRADYAVEGTNEWMLVTREQRLKSELAKATEENPSDLSWMILGGTFPNQDQYHSNWQGERGSNAVGGDGFINANRVWELWGIQNRDVYQDIAVPNGKYKVKAQAIYVSSDGASMSAAHYDAYKNGAEPTLGVIYANDVTTPMINVYDLVTDERLNDRNTKELGNGKWGYNGTNEFSTNMFEGKGWTEEIEVVVIDGKLRVGARVKDASSSWILIDNFTLKYLTSDLGIYTYIKALEEAIAKAETTLAETPATETLKTKLTEAITDGKAKLESTSEEEISAATGALNAAVEAVNSCVDNFNKLNALVAICEAENATPADEAFATAITAGKTALAEAADKDALSAPISKLVMNRRIVSGGRHNYTMESVAPADGVEAYLYNVGTGLFLAGSNDYGTHASVHYSARTVILHKDASDETLYSIQTNLPGGERGKSDLLGTNGFVDRPADATDIWAWEFRPAADGAYLIVNRQNEGENIYLGFTETDLLNVDANKAGADNKFNHWKLITKAQLDELLETASDENPVDATYLIKQPAFSWFDYEVDNRSEWDGLRGTAWEANYGGTHGMQGDKVVEMWNSGKQTEGPIYLKQTINGLKPGNYRVSVTGLYRDGSFAHAATVADNPEKWAYLTANDQQTLLPAITECADMYPGEGRLTDDKTMVFPDNTTSAAKYFQVGLYRTELDVTVAEKGENAGVLTIGVSKERLTDVVGDDWVVVDNFRLTYFGNPSATAIEDVETSGSKTEAIYNLQGQKLTKAVKGVNIINGKKVVIK